MSRLRLFEGSKPKYIIIALSYIIACFVLYLFGALYIQFMLFLASMAFFPAIIVQERSNRKGLASNLDPSEDEQWSRTKAELERVCDNIGKTKSTAQLHDLQRRRLSLENELRRIEWKLRESDMTQMYNAAKGNLRELPNLRTESGQEAENDQKNEKQYHDILAKILKEAEVILEHEPASSQRAALVPLANHLRAQFNMMKKNRLDDSFKDVFSDYFAVWATLSCLTKGMRADHWLTSYTSAKFRPRFLKLLKVVELHQGSNVTSEDAINARYQGERLAN